MAILTDRRALWLLAICTLCGCRENLLANLPDAAPAAPADAVVDAPPAYIVYLNRRPVTVMPGDQDSVANTSSLLNDVYTTPGSIMTDEKWATLLQCVREILAPFPIQVTTDDPGNVDHEEIIFAQSPSDVGAPAGLGFLAAPNCSGGAREVGYVFEGVDPSPTRALCENVVFPIGAAAGLDFSYKCEDVMSALGGCGDKSFLDQVVQCGEQAPADCECGDSLQNSYQAMLRYYGGLAQGQ